MKNLDVNLFRSKAHLGDFSKVDIGEIDDLMKLLGEVKMHAEADAVNAEIGEKEARKLRETMEGTERGQQILRLREVIEDELDTEFFGPKEQGLAKYRIMNDMPGIIDGEEVYLSDVLSEMEIGHLGIHGDQGDHDYGGYKTTVKVRLNETGDGVYLDYEGGEMDDAGRAELEGLIKKTIDQA